MSSIGELHFDDLFHGTSTSSYGTNAAVAAADAGSHEALMFDDDCATEQKSTGSSQLVVPVGTEKSNDSFAHDDEGANVDGSGNAADDATTPCPTESHRSLQMAQLDSKPSVPLDVMLISDGDLPAGDELNALVGADSSTCLSNGLPPLAEEACATPVERGTNVVGPWPLAANAEPNQTDSMAPPTGQHQVASTASLGIPADSRRSNLAPPDSSPRRTKKSSVLRRSRRIDVRNRVTKDDFDFIKLVGRGGFGKVYLAELKRESSVALIAQQRSAGVARPLPSVTVNSDVSGDSDSVDDGQCSTTATSDPEPSDARVTPDLPRVFAIKVFRKDFLVETNSVESTRFERDMLRSFDHPFIVRLHYAFQCAGRLYLCMDFLQGGPLFAQLRDQATFSEAMVRFYTAELVLALCALHADNVVHRDIKPENILLDCEGHVRLTDFGFARYLEDGHTSTSFCGTLDYMSPEVVSKTGHGIPTDWWSLGVLIYDMLTGKPPFSHPNRHTLQERILKGRVKYPTYLTSDVVSLMKGLMQRDPTKRLAGPGIRRHKFFKNMSWKKVLARQLPVPFVPTQPDHPTDTTNFDDEYTSLPVSMSPAKVQLSPSSKDVFKNFSYARSPVFPDHFPTAE